MINKKTIDMYLNKQFNNLFVLEIYQKESNGRNKSYCRCKCICGNENYHILVSDLKKSSSCGCIKRLNGKNKIEEHKSKYVGLSYISEKYGKFTIIDYISSKKVYIMFENTKNIECVHFSHIKDGEIKDSHSPKSKGGYFSRGRYNTKNGFGEISYKKWRWMLIRCYDEKFLEKQPTYKGCRVCEEWLNFQTFSSWLEKNWYECKNLELDKDLLCYGNKVYSPTTCCLIPKTLNHSLVYNRFDVKHMTKLYDNYKNILPQSVLEVLVKLTIYEEGEAEK